VTSNHPHPHPHVHEHPPTPAPSTEGSVVLDIGQDTGALVIRTGPEQDGLEIEVSPVGEPRQRTHAAVRPRHLPGRTLYCVVITPLQAGEYTIWRQKGQDQVESVVTVTGGSVSEYRWT
jgi:hypothetical protein